MISSTYPGIGNITIGADYLGGLFSLDGVHPSNIGQALVARAFIETHNSRYREKLPVNQLSEAQLLNIVRDDPFLWTSTATACNAEDRAPDYWKHWRRF